jgi:hypothetical protein
LAAGVTAGAGVASGSGTRQSVGLGVWKGSTEIIGAGERTAVGLGVGRLSVGRMMTLVGLPCGGVGVSASGISLMQPEARRAKATSRFNRSGST